MTLSIHQSGSGISLRYPIINGLMFNVSWFAIVTSASSTLAPIIVGLHLLIHFAVMGRGQLEVLVVAQVTLLGVIIDQLLFMAGVFTVDGHSSLPPVWMSCIWPIFATTLMHAFATLQTRYLIASVAGAVGGGVSFIAGTRLTNVAFGSELYGPIIIAVIWAVLFPLLLQIPRANTQPRSQAHD